MTVEFSSEDAVGLGVRELHGDSGLFLSFKVAKQTSAAVL